MYIKDCLLYINCETRPHFQKERATVYSDGECSFLLFNYCYRTKCHSGVTLKQQFLERVCASTIDPLEVK